LHSSDSYLSRIRLIGTINYKSNLWYTKKMAETENQFEKDIIATKNADIYYGSFRAVKNVTLDIPQHEITAIIGSSGCGKSTYLRALNRMNDLIPGTHVNGEFLFRGVNIYDPEIEPVAIRSKIGMVFQKPNPFPKSIFDNIAWGLKMTGNTENLNESVEHALVQAVLWDEVKDHLNESAMSLSGGQQQRLCIARTISVKPDVILMDEPCSALDPIATLKVEELMRELSKEYTIIIVTHNMQQAARVSDFTAFFSMDTDRAGIMVEYDITSKIFTNPKQQETEDYITGRFG
jgi:phosphate transport system ATP-binding protein